MKRAALLALMILINIGCCKGPIRVGCRQSACEDNTGYPLSNATTWVIVGIGQSNLLGRGQSMPFPTNPLVTLTRDIPTGPAYYAASRIASAHGVHVILDECSESSTPIERWVPGGDRYERCVAETRELLKQPNTQLAGIFFYQGEADTRDHINTAWPREFEGLIRSFRSTFNAPTLPVIWAQLGMLGKESAQNHDTLEYWNEFKANQLAVSLPGYARMVTTEDQPVVDDVHHDYDANVVIGNRFADAWENLTYPQ